MRWMLKLTVLLLAAVGMSFVVEGAGAKPIDIYILAGQSNAEGRNPWYEYAPHWHEGVSDVLIHTEPAASGDGWVPMSCCHAVSTCCGEVLEDIAGPYLSFGDYLNDRSGGTKIGIILVAQGSSDLAVQWSPPSGAQWAEFVSDYTAAMSQLASLGYTANVKGMAFLQGESDAQAEAPSLAYGANLNTFIAAVRAFTGIPDLKLVIWKMWGRFLVYRDNVRNAQAAVAAADENVVLLQADGAPDGPLDQRGDNVHFGPSETGYIELGRMLAGEFSPLRHGDPVPVMPVPALSIMFFSIAVYGSHRLRNWQDG